MAQINTDARSYFIDIFCSHAENNTNYTSLIIPWIGQDRNLQSDKILILNRTENDTV